MNINRTCLFRIKALILCGLLTATVSAQSVHTKHTYKLDSEESRAVASIEDAAWLAGNWVGTAFGQEFEEVWNPPSAGTMVGMFKLFNDEQVNFYEILVLEQDGASLSLKVKHVGSNFHAWEDKEEFINFKLVKVEPDALHFSGLSFYRTGDDTIDGYIVMKGRDGQIREEHLVYQRR